IATMTLAASDVSSIRKRINPAFSYSQICFSKAAKRSGDTNKGVALTKNIPATLARDQRKAFLRPWRLSELPVICQCREMIFLVLINATKQIPAKNAPSGGNTNPRPNEPATSAVAPSNVAIENELSPGCELRRSCEPG